MNSSDHMATGNATRVSKDSLKSQVTAKKLIGKAVYDNGGKKIGSVEDIVFHDSGSSLSGAFADQGSSSANSVAGGSMSGAASTSRSEAASARADTFSGAGNSSGSISGTTASGTGSNSASIGTPTAGTGYAGSSNGSGDKSSASHGSRGDWSAQSGSSDQQEPAVIISTGGFAGIGGTMYRVPMSQLSYDSAQDRFTLEVSEMDLSRLKDTGDLAARSDN